MSPSTIAPPETFTASAHDLDQAREIGTRLYYPQKLSVIDRRNTVSMSVRAGRIGPFTLGNLGYGVDVRIDADELETSYHVNLPVEGHLQSHHRGHEVIATPQRAAVYGPVGRTLLSRWEADCRLLCVKIDRHAIESSLSAQLGREVLRPVTLDPALDLRSDPGRAWANLVTMLEDQLHRPGSLLHQPLVAAALVDGLLNGLLCAVRHEYSDVLAGEHRPCRSPIVKQALDYLHTRAAEPITTTDLASHCCISVRALQEGFLRELGCSPMRYLRNLRLRRAHDELLAADPHVVTVARVAHQWGFTNAGRFATAHEAAFGERPAQTLRRTS